MGEDRSQEAGWVDLKVYDVKAQAFSRQKGALGIF